MAAGQGQNLSAGLKVNLTVKNTSAFIALVFVLHEMHEIVHTTVGRIICGCWGGRNFNLFWLCENCADEVPVSILSTIAGPVFTFAVLYIGYHFLNNKFDNDLRKKSIGFALVFANLPFGRILTAVIAGGDETFILENLFTQQSSTFIWLASLAIVVLLTLPPLFRAWETLNSSHKIWSYTGFLLVPLAFDIVIVLILMNSLYQQGVLDQAGLMGSPVIVNLWTLTWSIILIFSWRNLETLLQPIDGQLLCLYESD